MNGVSYMIDEEVPVHPDETTSSPETSDDDFYEDTDGLITQFKNSLANKIKLRTKQEKRDALKL